MRTFYTIQEVDGQGFWDDYYRKFRGYLWAEKFKTEEELLIYAQKQGIGIFKITK